MTEMDERVQGLLHEVIHPEHHGWWLNTPHPYVSHGDLTPQQLIDAGRAAEVEAYLTALAEGVVM